MKCGTQTGRAPRLNVKATISSLDPLFPFHFCFCFNFFKRETVLQENLGFRRRIFGLSLSKIVLGNDDFSIESDRSPGGSDRIDQSNLTHFILFDLPDGLIREYLLQDYASIRLTSKYSCKTLTFDDLSCTIACNNFPKATEMSLLRRLITKSSPYKFLPLSRINFTKLSMSVLRESPRLKNLVNWSNLFE